MKVTVLSDLHLEFDGPVPDLGTGDVLCLAGDVLTARNLNKDASSPKRQKYMEFLDRCSKNYDHVFYVAGNHEHYGHSVEKTTRDVRAVVPSNVHFMSENEYVLGDWVFLGTTLWTNLNNSNPLVEWTCKQNVTDFKAVTYNKGRFTPFHWRAEFNRNFYWLRDRVEHYTDKKVFVMTHHAPSFQSVPEIYRHGNSNTQMLNYAYFTDLEEFMLSNPNVKYWAHGHMHNSSNYMVGETNVLCNPYGYHGSETNPEFSLDFSVELS